MMPGAPSTYYQGRDQGSGTCHAAPEYMTPQYFQWMVDLTGTTQQQAANTLRHTKHYVYYYVVPVAPLVSYPHQAHPILLVPSWPIPPSNESSPKSRPTRSEILRLGCISVGPRRCAISHSSPSPYDAEPSQIKNTPHNHTRAHHIDIHDELPKSKRTHFQAQYTYAQTHYAYNQVSTEPERTLTPKEFVQEL
ncbi:unnamed protein product [Rhizoctonia solani]|uniref:Uncharacterized protein n=1 Tax=Rhizoctonia solani TaxID=456999 RepID=A0A8H3A4Q9_9AGAM|nr:unnamed protein product [Rhizoctonia solani]